MVLHKLRENSSAVSKKIFLYLLPYTIVLRLSIQSYKLHLFSVVLSHNFIIIIILKVNYSNKFIIRKALHPKKILITQHNSTELIVKCEGRLKQNVRERIKSIQTYRLHIWAFFLFSFSLLSLYEAQYCIHTCSLPAILILCAIILN